MGAGNNGYGWNRGLRILIVGGIVWYALASSPHFFSEFSVPIWVIILLVVFSRVFGNVSRQSRRQIYSEKPKNDFADEKPKHDFDLDGLEDDPHHYIVGDDGELVDIEEDEKPKRGDYL